MNCKHCGFELPDTAKFCRSCGKPQGVGIDQKVTAPVSAPAAPAPVAAPAAQAAPAPPPAASVAAPQPSPAPTPAPALQVAASTPAAKSNLVAYLAVAIGFIASVGGTGYWGWTQRVLAEEQKNIIAKFQAEEAARKAKIEAEEARVKKEAEDKARQEAEAEQARKEQEERDAKVAETSAALNWKGRYQCSELLSPGAKIKNEFAIDIAFTTTSGKGVFFRRNSEFVEKFVISINGTKVDIASEGSRTADPTKKWFVRTSGAFVGKTINTSGSMYGADGQQIVRQTCKIQVNQ
jgi:hypothetical protein